LRAAPTTSHALVAAALATVALFLLCALEVKSTLLPVRADTAAERALSSLFEVERATARAERLLRSAAREFAASRAQGGYGLAGSVRAQMAEEPWLRALEWMPTVPAAARGRYEEGRGIDWGALPRAGAPLRILEPAQAHAGGPVGRTPPAPRFAAARAEHHPLTFTEGQEHGVVGLGVDLGALPEVAAAIERARASGEPALTTGSPFVEGADGPATVYRLLLAVRAPPRDLGIAVDESSPEARGEGILGLVIDPARLAAEVTARSVAGHGSDGLAEITISDISETSDSTRSGARASSRGPGAVPVGSPSAATNERSIFVALGGRGLQVTARVPDVAGASRAEPRFWLLVTLTVIGVAGASFGGLQVARGLAQVRHALDGRATTDLAVASDARVGARGASSAEVKAGLDASGAPSDRQADDGAPTDGPGRLEARLEALRDALAHSEERARAIFGAVPDSMYRIMRDRRVIDCKAHGFKGLSTPSASLTARRLDEVFPESIVPAVEAAFALVVANRSVEVLRYSAPSLAASKGVGPRHYEARLAPHGPDEVLALIRDTTQQAELERVKHEFLAEVSHELKTPLTSILGALDLLARSHPPGPGAARDLLEIARSGADRIKAIVSDLLDIERMAQGKLTFDVRDVAPEEVVRPVVIALKAGAQSDGVTIATEVAPDAPAVRADARRVVQVLTNLVENAVRFSPEGATVFVRVGREPTGRVRFSVLDRGPGIPEEQQPRLFQRFVQLEKPRRVRRGGSGSGLGLAVAKGLVESQGGRIGLTSRVGLGSTFWFEFPVASEETVPKGSREATPEAPAPAAG